MICMSERAPKNHIRLLAFSSMDFGSSSKLEGWLKERRDELCHAAWHASGHKSILNRVECGRLATQLRIPLNLTIYTHLILTMKGHDSQLIQFRDSADHWENWDILTSLTNYASVVGVLFGFLKQSFLSDVRSAHTIAKDIHTHLSRDIFIIVVQLVLLLRDPETYKQFLDSRGTQSQVLLDLLQDLLDHDLSVLRAARPLLVKAMIRLSRASGAHPKCFALPNLRKVGEQIAGGGFSDIWKGVVGGQSVSLKIMRFFRDAEVDTLLKEFGREAVIWRQMCHPNLLPFFGLYYLDKRLCLVSPWMENGNILEFLRTDLSNTTDNLSLILDVARGLEYLHENRIVHGDLKAINILVTPSRRACIADFGLSSIADAMTLRFTHSTAPTTRGGTTRYQAPELLLGESPNHFGSDVYAFACVCYEILTLKAPFHELFNDAAVMFKVLAGARPSRPTGTLLIDGLWDLLQACWQTIPDERPTGAQIVEWLTGPCIQAKASQATADWDETYSSKFRRSLQTQPLLPSLAQIERILFDDGL
ncbi:kinase-like domain-containing protein [Mycena vulgaris]|nr:kinase-like domain-containing protein [Mycena vulgaris]